MMRSRWGRRARVIGVVLVLAGLLTGGASAAGAATSPGVAPKPRPAADDQPESQRTLTVRTVPPVPGVTFRFLDRTFVSGANGVAAIAVTVDERNQLAHDRSAVLSVASPTVRIDDTKRATFSGWAGKGTYQWSPTDPVGAIETATFDTDRLMTFRFTDQHAAPISTERVQRFAIRSNTGAVDRFAPGTARWLASTETTVGPDGPVIRKLSYSIVTAEVQRSNLVNVGQQRFTPADRAAVTVSLLFFRVTFHASDAIFGSASRGHLVLQFPDKSTKKVELDQGRATLTGLPRGLYQISVKGAGPANSRPLAISSSKTIQVDVVTWRDVATVLGSLVTVAILVLLMAFLVRRRHARVSSPDIPETIPRPPRVEREPVDVLR